MKLRLFCLAKASPKDYRMVSTQLIQQKNSFEPLHEIIVVTEKQLIRTPPENIKPNIVGEKALGLSCLPEFWTLPFFVISSELLSTYRKKFREKEELSFKSWVKQILLASFLVGIKEKDLIIVRSSGHTEGIEDRGKFYSVSGKLSDIITPLSACLKKLTTDSDLNYLNVPLIIQKYATPISAKGHLSNERRFYKEKRDWLGDFEKNTQGKKAPFQINLRSWRKKINSTKWIENILSCNYSPQIQEILKIPATWGYERKVRIHFEWVWDGEAIYIVQADKANIHNGVNPTRQLTNGNHLTVTNFTPKCLKKITKEHAKKYHKIKNVFTYLNLGLPIVSLYVLDDQNTINNLSLNQVPADLKEDIRKLVKGSLVIRIDIDTSDQKRRQMLPRTQEVRDVDNAIEWLKEKSYEIKRLNTKDNIIFIFHNFIPAQASAFAYAAPEERKVQIESLWGIPEGLYYNSHDKYVVDTKFSKIKKVLQKNINDFTVKVHTNFKHFFVSPDEHGNWKTEILAQPYDWRETINNHLWVKQIALQSRQIAESEGSPVSIMWFVGVSENISKTPVFPWFHESCNLNRANRKATQRSKTPFDRKLIIQTNKDIAYLKSEAAAKTSNISLIKIQPQEEALLRDKNTLQLIGKLAKKIDAIILLEGGVLSHAYYQLIETKATVEVVHPFSDTLEERHEFNKLVRDKIPSKIIDAGEFATKATLSGEYLLHALREKLIEESFEVLDAADQESIIDELADVSEVIDAIISLLGVDKRELKERQEQKKKQVGGFEDGSVLLKTKNPLPAKKDKPSSLFNTKHFLSESNTLTIDNRKLLELGKKIKKWTDKKSHHGVKEELLRLVVPMVRDSWSAEPPINEINLQENKKIRVKISGKRVKAKMQIELSIFSSPKQLKLFE